MKLSISTIALIASLSFAGAALAQDPPAGGPSAKGNAPLKNVHTVNDGAPRKGANSFTQNEARKHILNSGYTDVSGLAKGKDGVWRGTATKDGTTRAVALDFKGNVSEGGPGAIADQAVHASGAKPRPVVVGAASSGGPSGSALAQGSAAMNSATASPHHMRHRRHHFWRHHHGKARCANPGPNGAACSGQDRNRNGISDKEDHAIKAGAKP